MEEIDKPISQKEIERLWKIRREGCFIDWDNVKKESRIIEEIVFSIKVDPRGKGRPRFRSCGKFVQTYTDKVTKLYEKELIELSSSYAPLEPFSGPISINTIFYKKKPKCYPKRITQWTKKPDLDNMEKALWDAFNGIFWIDDAQIVDNSSSKRYSDHGHIDIIIRAFSQE